MIVIATHLAPAQKQPCATGRRAVFRQNERRERVPCTNVKAIRKEIAIVGGGKPALW
jgi:hypothetical protein